MIVALLVAFIVVLIDQGVKYWITMTLPLYQVRSFIPGTLDLTHIRNHGASWGILQGEQFFFVSLTFAVLGYLFYRIYRYKFSSAWVYIGYGCLIGGAMGNLIDRLLNGYVVDMLALRWFEFPIFNVADMALTFGVGILILLTVREIEI